MARLGRAFFARPSTEVAPDLLGRELVRRVSGEERLAARIVETEAYAEGDPASHSFRGLTSRNAVMFGRPGHLYVYFTYGMHFCMNVVTGRVGEGSAVLLRAAEPLRGLERMAARRGSDDPVALCSGPARLCQAFGVDRSHNGSDLVSGEELWLLPGEPVDEHRILVGPRVGIRTGVDEAWRFWIVGDPFVSRGRPGPPSAGGRTRIRD